MATLAVRRSQLLKTPRDPAEVRNAAKTPTGARRRPYGSLVVAGAWVAAFLMVSASIMLGPAITLVLPWLIFGGMSTVTAAYRYASETD